MGGEGRILLWTRVTEMKMLSIGAVAVALMASSALAGGGGKIKFSEGKQHDQLLAEAKASGTPVMLYFTGEG